MTSNDLELPVTTLARSVRNSHGWTRLGLMAGAAFADWAVIGGFAYLTGMVYHRLAGGDWWAAPFQLDFSLLVASFFVLLSTLRGQYTLTSYVGARRSIGRTLGLWIATFITLLAFAFATKSTELFSRATVTAVFLLGLPLVLCLRLALGRALTVGSKIGVLPARRVMLVGCEEDVTAFAIHYQPWNAGIHVAGIGTLPADPAATGDEDIARIVGQAREMYLDDVMIIVPWSQTQLIARLIDSFMRIPVALHLGPERILDRFSQIRIAKSGAIASLQLGRPPLTPPEIMAKRAMDVMVGSFALFLLTPVLALIALAIKLDSPGPVLFRQQRLGFNQRAFQIVKFRSMTVAEDGDAVRQATRNDARVTRVGRFLRRWNLDELPQLLNVLAGQMSLVGPRPHAIAHDREYDTRISLYARRHNVKPGITGWAQVHGFRGETDADSMKARVEHDLYYIDNWSILLDMEILVRTVVTRKAYRNAF